MEIIMNTAKTKAVCFPIIYLNQNAPFLSSYEKLDGYPHASLGREQIISCKFQLRNYGMRLQTGWAR
jgi:hypothetical protein